MADVGPSKRAGERRGGPLVAAGASLPRAGVSERVQMVDQVAWLAAVPAALVGLMAIVWLGPVLGHALLAPGDVHFWPDVGFEVRPEPVEQGRFLVALTVPLLLIAFIVAGMRIRSWRRTTGVDVLVGLIQLGGVAFAALCLLQQQHEVLGPLYRPDGAIRPPFVYFSWAALGVAALGTIGAFALARGAHARGIAAQLLRETRTRRIVASLIAVVATVVWLLHAYFTEHTIAPAFREVVYNIQFTMDETFAVLDGRSPLVDFAAQYGSLWPYPFAAAMWAFGETLGVWVALALIATGLGMVAIFATLRRAARSSLGGLLLFLPVLAASFFRIAGSHDQWYSFASYYGTFPMRYAGPSILAWLVARHLGGDAPRRLWPLFVAAGLVVLNNADAGIPALGATVAAALCADGALTRARLGRMALEAVAGLAGAFGLVSLLTLVRAGALPDLALLVRYAHLFASSGFGMVAMPTIGLHLVIYLTYVAAVGVVVSRIVRGETDRVLTGLIAWSAIFGLGVGSYFAGRSTTDDVPAMFLPWTFALALLVIPALRSLRLASWRRPPFAATACIFGFLVMACSLADTSAPWSQLRRLSHTSEPILAAPVGQRFVAEHTRPGEPVAILVLLGHRIGANVGVSNISPYTNSLAMPTAEQLEETVDILRRAGGHKVFLRPEFTAPEMEGILRYDGFELEAEDGQGMTTLWSDESR